MLKRIREKYPTHPFVTIDGYNRAIVGVEERSMKIIYSKSVCVAILMSEHDKSIHEAFIYFNEELSPIYSESVIFSSDYFESAKKGTPYNKMVILIDVINSTLGVDILSKRRFKPIVQGRYIYSKILRDMGIYSYGEIGIPIRKDHATIMHYLRNIDWDLEHDSTLKSNYLLCKSIFDKSIN